ncbi:MAG: RHS repeat-associated core domain-containing protein [Pirellulales bacterium]
MNEITDISGFWPARVGHPGLQLAGNMTEPIPKPADPTQSFTGTYDAWNRLVKLEDGSGTVAQYEYDGAKRRTVKKAYTSGTLSETRHFYYTEPSRWQVVEERVESSSDADRQFVWGLRYVDDIVLRDRDTDADGTLDERLYGLQDANWNVTALTQPDAMVALRFGYASYGMSVVLSATFAPFHSSTRGWELRFSGYRLDCDTAVMHIRHRYYLGTLGVFIQRDPATELEPYSLYEFLLSRPHSLVDWSGAAPASASCVIWVFAFSWAATGCIFCLAFLIAGGPKPVGLLHCLEACCLASAAFQALDAQCPAQKQCAKHPRFWDLMNQICFVNSFAFALRYLIPRRRHFAIFDANCTSRGDNRENLLVNETSGFAA